MIHIHNLQFGYRRNKPDLFNDFNLSLERGRVYGLLGKNGTGKSTLLHLMCGLLTPRKGEILLNGVNVRKRLPVTLEDTFLIPEEFNLPPITLCTFMELNAPFYPRFSKEELVKYLHFFELDIDLNLGELSMGQKKKVFMSFGLATNTSLLIMDEPTNGLDIPGKSQFRKFITAGMSEEKCIVISTHQVKDVENILDHIIIMEKNRVLLNESYRNIANRFLFTESDDPQLKQRALYALPSLKGEYLVLPNDSDHESDINLEILFQAIITSPEKFITPLAN